MVGDPRAENGGRVSNLNELPEFRYDPDTETMFRKSGEGWVELGCMECDWTAEYPANTEPVFTIDE